MKRVLFVLVMLFGLTLAACGGATQTPAAPIPTVALENAFARPSGRVTASAEVVPVEHVNLGFALTGVVNNVQVQVGDRVTAGQTLVTLDTAILEARVKEAEANLAVAQAQVNYLRRVRTPNEQIEKALAEVERAQAALDAARATLSQAVLTTPIAGTVVAVETSIGETVMPGQVLVVIGDFSHMRIETTDLSERDVPRVRLGQTASVYIEALDREVSGKVIAIDQQAGTVGGDVVFKVTIELDQQPEGLLWGMSAEVRIQTDG